MKKLFIVTLFTAIALIAGAQKNTAELRLNLEKGKTYTQTGNVKMNMKMEMMGTKIDTDVPMSIAISMKVVDICDDNFVIETTYDAIKMNFNIAGQEMSFDSADPNPDPENAFTQMFSSFIGKPFTMILDKRQNIVAIEGLDKIFSAMFDNEQLSDEQKEKMNATLQGIWNEEKIKENFSEGNIVFPEEPIYKGFTWTGEKMQNMQGIAMQVKNTYTVEKITATTVEIAMVSEISMNMAMTENEISMNITVGNAQSTGRYTIDLATGLTQSAKISTDMTMVMTTNMDGTEITIPMHITAEMTVK